MKIKRKIALLLCIVLSLSLISCGSNNENDTSKENIDSLSENVAKEEIGEIQETQQNEAPVSFSKTEVQEKADYFVPIGDVASYNKNIITDEIISNCNINDVDASALPYWTGYILENKAFKNLPPSNLWANYTAGGEYFCEEEIRYLKETGFNCVRICYSFSYLSNPDDINSINLSELEQLDEVISWCMKYDITCILSITGMPGKANTSREEEDLCCSAEVFTNPEMQQVFQNYWAMISNRYQDIPNGVLVYELMAEPTRPDETLDDDDAAMEAYVNILTPIVEKIRSHREDRVIIVNDLWKRVPEKMAEMGCCLSLHTHVYYINKDGVRDALGVDVETKWPMPYLPICLSPENGPFTLCAEDEFKGATIQYYMSEIWGSAEPDVLVDDNNFEYQILYNDAGTAYIEINVPDGAKNVTIKAEGDVGANIRVTKIIYEDGTTIDLLSTDSVTNWLDTMPTLQINKDGSVSCLSGQTLDGDFIYEKAIAPFVDCAKKNNVTFVMTEVGTDTESLTVEEYIAYHEMWLTMLKSHNLGWMYNCQRNFFAPLNLMWMKTNSAPFNNFTQWENTVYYECDEVAELLKKYQ